MPKTFRDVELVSVGEHGASTGRVTITPEHLESMLAAQSDAQVDHRPIKLGHVSSLNAGIGDGSPAYGWVTPKRIGPRASDGKLALFGDLEHMPDLLADAAPVAYRRRSGEIDWNTKGSNGKTYPAVLSAIALLGETPPACKGMADMGAPVMLGAAESSSTILIVEGLADQPVQVAMLAAAVNAGATVAEVDAMATAAGARDTVHVPPPVEDSVNDETTSHPANAGPATEGNTMTVTDEQLRKLLKIEEGKSVDDEVARLLAEHETPATNADGTPVVTPATPAVPAATATPAAPAATEPAPVPELATATLSADSLRQLQADAAWAGNERRRRVLDEAVQAGRLSPAERGKLTTELSAGETAPTGFAAALERDEEGTKTLLSGLTPRFPTTELGGDEANTAAAGDEAWAEFNKSVFPDLANG